MTLAYRGEHVDFCLDCRVSERENVVLDVGLARADGEEVEVARDVHGDRRRRLATAARGILVSRERYRVPQMTARRPYLDLDRTSRRGEFKRGKVDLANGLFLRPRPDAVAVGLHFVEQMRLAADREAAEGGVESRRTSVLTVGVHGLDAIRRGFADSGLRWLVLNPGQDF